jgi:hypothetical protein
VEGFPRQATNGRRRDKGIDLRIKYI